MNGLTNANAILSEIEDRVPHIQMKFFREKSVIEGLKRIENIGLAIDRFEKLGYNTVDYALKSEEFTTALQTLAAIPEEKYQQIATDMDRYFFLHRSYHGLDRNEKDLSGDLRALAGVVKNEGFTEEERDKLELARTLAIATGKIPLTNTAGVVNSGEYYYSDHTLDRVLSEGISGKAGEDLLWIVEDMVYQTNGRVVFSQYFFPNAFSFMSDGGVAVMSELSAKGWNPFNAEIALNSHEFTGKKAQVIGQLQEALTFSSDSEKTAWASLIRELTGKEGERLVDDETTLYETLYKNRSVVGGLAVLAKDAEVDLSELVSFSNGEMHGRNYKLAEVLYKMSEKEGISPEEASFYRIMQSYLTSGGWNYQKLVENSDIPLLSYFMQNKGRFGELYGENGPTASLVSELIQQEGPPTNAVKQLVGNCQDVEKISPDLVFANRELFRLEQIHRVVRALPESYIKLLPPSEREMFEVLRNYANNINSYGGVCEYALSHRENAALYAADGHFTAKFFSDYVRDSGDTYSINSLLTDETLASFPPNERTFWTFYKNKPGAQRFLAVHRDKFDTYVIDGQMSATFVNDYITELGLPENLNEFISDQALATFPENEKQFWGFVKKAPQTMQRFLYERRDRFADYVRDGKAQLSFIEEYIREQGVGFVSQVLTDATIADFPEQERPFWAFFREASGPVQEFILQQKEEFSKYVSDGILQFSFVENYLQSGRGVDFILPLLTDAALATFPEQERPFWAYVRSANPDIRQFLLAKPRDFYIKEDRFDEAAAAKDFLQEIRAAPENCRTYESLIQVFNDLRLRHPGGDALGELYLRIAVAHRVRTIGERTEVERMEELRAAFSSLFNMDMTSFERLSWKILERQLPFTANEQARNDMRQKALDVEALDIQRLGWVHQSVHNYASVYEVDYLRSFREFLHTGDRSKLDELKSRFDGISRAPDYIEEDRIALRAIPTLEQELDQMIELASQFYEIRPETLRSVMQTIPGVFLDGELPTQIDSQQRDLVLISKTEKITTIDEKERAVRFIRTANRARETLLRLVAREGATVQEKTFGLLVDAILDDVSQKMFTQYKDYMLGKVKLTQEDIIEATTMLGETIKASRLNGEVGDDVQGTAKKLEGFADATNISREAIHSTRLLLPVLQRSINTYWQRFTEAARPEMVQMLMRTGMSEREATERVMFTDLVEFRKSSTAFILDPFMDIVTKGLAEIEPIFEGELPTPESVYGTQSFETMINTAQSNPAVVAFTVGLLEKRMPAEIVDASRFLTDIYNSQEAKVARLVGVKIPDYIDRQTLKPRYTIVERNGKTIEFFPVTYYGVDMVVVLEDGKRVENPYEFFKKNFEVLAVDEHLLREGD